MNTEYAVGNLRIHFESRARRRWFVAAFFAVLAGLGFAPFSAHPTALTVWIVGGYAAIFGAFVIVFTWIAGDPRIRGDEREMHRRDHAHYVAYRILLYSFLAACVCYFALATIRQLAGTNPVFQPLILRGSLMMPFHFMPFCMLFGSLPQAILLWTEPDMEESQ